MKPLALITGASGGIGEELARQMAHKYRLVLVARSQDKLTALAQELGGAETIALDLAAHGAVQTLHAELEVRGLEVEVLVNNAGVGDYGEFANTPAHKLEQMIFLMAVYYASKAYVLSLGEALDEELKGTGVSVTTLCPGPVATGFQERAAMHESKLLSNKMNPMTTVQEVASDALSALENHQRIVIPGLMNKINTFSTRFIPRAMIPAMIKNIQARGH
jgi:uncharacterized protein